MVWKLWSENIPNTVIRISERPEESSLVDPSWHPKRGNSNCPAFLMGCMRPNWDTRCENSLESRVQAALFLQSLRIPHLEISSSRNKHFGVWRKAKVGHPASMSSSSFFYWNRSTQMKKLTVWDIPYLQKWYTVH